jgi:hypothetical protein
MIHTNHFISLCIALLYSSVEEDSTMRVSDTVPYGIPQAQGNSARLPPAPSTLGACNDPKSFKVIDSGLEVAHTTYLSLNQRFQILNLQRYQRGVNGSPGLSKRPCTRHPCLGTIGAIEEIMKVPALSLTVVVCYLIARPFDDAGNGRSTLAINEGIDWAIEPRS